MVCLELLKTDVGFVLIASVLAWLIAGSFKYIFSLFKKDHGSFFQEFSHSGGMPSQHSAMVSALTLSIFLTEGFTTMFVVTFVLTLIIMYDATHVRLSVGKQAELLLDLAKKMKLKTKLKIVKGHSFSEVLVGASIGLFVSGLLLLIL